MNVQHKLLVVRPPRVGITYDVETGGAQEKRELPFIGGIISDLAGEQELPPLHLRRFIFIDGNNFDDIMKFINPMIKINFGDEETNLEFHEFGDFSPDSIVKKIPQLTKLLEERITLTDLSSKLDGNFELEAALNVLIDDPANTTQALDHIGEDKENGQKLIDTFVNSLQGEKNIPNVYEFIQTKIAHTDTMLSDGMSHILHNKKFRTLESAWLALRYLVINTPSSEHLQLRVLSASKNELESDLYKCASFDLSSIHDKINSQEFDTPGGMPYSCIILDLYLGKSQSDIKLLQKLSEVASAAHAPLITAASPEMFGVKSFRELSKIRDIRKLFESSELAGFNGLRDLEESRYLALGMARALGRAPYHRINNPISSFQFNESCATDEEFCWINPAYCIAGRIINAYSLYGWVAAMRGIEGGGLIENLPVHTFKTEQGDVVMQCPLEIAITDRVENELSKLGFMPISHIKNTNKGVIFGGQTVQRHKLYNEKNATANAALSARLPYIMNASRFAHYIKVMMRSKIGSSMTAGEIETFLQSWLAKYILLSENSSQETKARIPLKEGKITVTDDEERPGSYKAILYLRPHFQMEDLTTSIRLVAKIPELTRG